MSLRKYIQYSLAFATVLGMIYSCSKPITKSLFQQSGRAHIYLPTDKEERQGVLAEQVSYRTTVDTIRSTAKKPVDELGEGIDLQTLTVVADRPKIKISTIRNGKINLRFLVTLPKQFMDPRWQVVLTPKLLNGEETRSLPPVVLKGTDFARVQRTQIERYGQFEQSIVDSARYDSTFFDQKKFDGFMTRLQRSYFSSYWRDYKLQRRYDSWLRKMQERQLFFNARRTGDYDTDINNKALSMLSKAYDMDLYGEDSASLRRAFAAKYDAEHRQKYLTSRLMQIKEEDVPRAYRYHFRHNLTMDSIKNRSVTELDSLTVAKHTYDFRSIARNESKRGAKDIYRKHMVQFPLIEGAGVEDSIKSGKDYVHMYSHDIEVTEDLQRRLAVVLDTRVTAIDQTSWSQIGMDTLSFIVSGLNDLVDTSLADRLSDEQRKDYDEGLKRLAVRDYRGAIDILRFFPDFNSALCLTAMGHNDQALKLLEQLTPTGKIEYLKAIIFSRRGDWASAKACLISAARLESVLAFKVDVDPEFVQLLEQYPTLAEELVDIADGLDE
ncbi:MAG: hypothetical protein Q4A61_00955 [Porphyromonadaceae bacterium]|nr:hypothetical protein [Porphyromonadaceae bacterium]